MSIWERRGAPKGCHDSRINRERRGAETLRDMSIWGVPRIRRRKDSGYVHLSSAV